MQCKAIYWVPTKFWQNLGSFYLDLTVPVIFDVQMVIFWGFWNGGLVISGFCLDLSVLVNV